jgi:hypothetical protein
MMQAILASHSFSGSAGASKLVGRLHFTLGWTLHRFGRAALQPLHVACSPDAGSRLIPEARASIQFLIYLLVDADGNVRRRLRRYTVPRLGLTQPSPVLVWSFFNHS